MEQNIWLSLSESLNNSLNRLVQNHWFVEEQNTTVCCGGTFSVGVCNIVCNNIVIVVLTMCNLTLSSILQKQKQNTYGVHTYISLRDEVG